MPNKPDKLLKLLSNSLSYSDQFVLFANSPEVMRSWTAPEGVF